MAESGTTGRGREHNNEDRTRLVLDNPRVFESVSLNDATVSGYDSCSRRNFDKDIDEDEGEKVCNDDDDAVVFCYEESEASDLSSRGSSAWSKEEFEDEYWSNYTNKNEKEEKAVTEIIGDLTLSEAASKLNSNHLAEFLASVECGCGEDHIKLGEFERYMATAFSQVSSFQWITRELNIHHTYYKNRLAKIPLAKVPGDVWKILTYWLNQLSSVVAFKSFVLRTLGYLYSAVPPINKESVLFDTPKYPVGYLFALAMVLRCRPDIFISVWSTPINPDPATLTILAWVISQIRQGDWTFALFMWVKYLYPLLFSAILREETIDIIFEVIDSLGGFTCPFIDQVDHGVRIGGFRCPYIDKVDYGVTIFEKIARIAFPANPRLKDEAVSHLSYNYYHVLEHAMRETPGSKVCEKLIPFVLKAAVEDSCDLAKEARGIFKWCLCINPCGSFRLWVDEGMFLENLDGSVFLLGILSVKWRRMLLNDPYFLAPLMKAMKRLVSKIEKALAAEHDAARRATLERAQIYAKSIVGPYITLDWENLEDIKSPRIKFVSRKLRCYLINPDALFRPMYKVKYNGNKT